MPFNFNGGFTSAPIVVSGPGASGIHPPLPSSSTSPFSLSIPSKVAPRPEFVLFDPGPSVLSVPSGARFPAVSSASVLSVPQGARFPQSSQPAVLAASGRGSPASRRPNPRPLVDQAPRSSSVTGALSSFANLFGSIAAQSARPVPGSRSLPTPRAAGDPLDGGLVPVFFDSGGGGFGGFELTPATMAMIAVAGVALFFIARRD